MEKAAVNVDSKFQSNQNVLIQVNNKIGTHLYF